MKYMTMVALALLGCLFSIAGEVQNGQQPKGSPQTLVFTEDLRFGANEDDFDYVFTGLNPNVAAASNGHIFVADPGENHVMEYDANGKFVREIGGHGAGPGEFDNLLKFTILQGGGAMAFDIAGGRGRFTRFDADMKYQKTYLPKDASLLINNATISPKGDFMGAFYTLLDLNKGITTQKMGVLDLAFEPKMVLMEREQAAFDPARMSDSTYWSDYIADAFRLYFGGTVIVNFDAQGRAITARASKYEITCWDEALKKPRMVIKRDYKPVAANEEYLDALVERQAELVRSLIPGPLRAVISENVIRNAVTKAKPPPHKLPVNALLPMEDGGLLVGHDYRLESGECTADIFDKDGQFLGQTSLPNNAIMGPDMQPRMMFRNGFAYTVETDAEENHTIVRYRYSLAPSKR